MSMQEDSRQALLILQDLRSQWKNDGRCDAQTDEDLMTLISLLEGPVFKQLLAIQDSVEGLRSSVDIGELECDDFDFSRDGNLILSVDAEDRIYHAKSQPRLEAEITADNVVEDEGELSPEEESSIQQDLSAVPLPLPLEEFDPQVFEEAVLLGARGRDIVLIDLYKPENTSLGFSVLGLKSEDRGELGIFVQEIQPEGIADLDGRIQVSDQILAIDKRVLDASISHPQAIRILQSVQGFVQLVVARGPEPGFEQPESVQDEGTTIPGTESVNEMVLNTEWTQLEVIDLINDGSGLGFGIIGGKSTGVVVKTLLPGGIADRDGRLRIGDHILQIGDVNVRGMASEQVASVLRQLGCHVRLVVARAIQEPPQVQNPTAPIIPTHQLEIHLAHLFSHDSHENLDMIEHDDQHHDRQQSRSPQSPQPENTQVQINHSQPDVPEDQVEFYEVALVKNEHGLGITIAGYVGENEDDLCGIFVRSVAEGSPADKDGRMKVRDHIIAVDNQSLTGLTNPEAVDVLKQSGEVVKLKFARYISGPKFDKLQEYAAQAELVTSTPYITESDSAIPPVNGTYSHCDSPEIPALPTSAIPDEPEPMDESEKTDEPSVSSELEASLIAKWQPVVGDDQEIVIAMITKFRERGGLGIGLQGTVDLENGMEVHPHHYIRSFRADGPVGLNGKLKVGDELLEVNGQVLYGLSHVEVVHVLKELPREVYIVCSRYKESDGEDEEQEVPPTDQELEEFFGERLVKSKSEQALHAAPEIDASFERKSRSLEPLCGLAMWTDDIVVIDLEKGDTGLGFCILDYQDPINPSETVIVVRSLVPGGIAQKDGRLVPGDRLIFVNDENLENASVDQAIRVLKGTPKGIVRIGVAKPLPFSETLDEFDWEQEMVAGEGSSRPGSRPPSVVNRRLSQTVFGEIPPLPSALERKIRIKKGNHQQLGLVLEPVDKGMNGGLVLQVLDNSAVDQEGSIKGGDFIVSINNESLRHSTKAQIRAILRRVSLIGIEFTICYIPSADAQVYRESALILLRERDQPPQPHHYPNEGSDYPNERSDYPNDESADYPNESSDYPNGEYPDDYPEDNNPFAEKNPFSGYNDLPHQYPASDDYNQFTDESKFHLRHDYDGSTA